MEQFESKEIKVTCPDGIALAATLFEPQKTIKGAIIIGPATGIKRQFYSHFARHLANHGYGVITFDNRGIGQSCLDGVEKSDATLQCWGEIDMPSALRTLQQAFKDTKYHLIGHSAGGQLAGLMHNSDQLSSMYNIGSSSGQLKNMKMPYLFKAHFFMNFFIPLSNRLFGYTKSHWFGMGEPLPKGVATQWSFWCNGQGYCKTSFGKSIDKHQYDDLTLPSMWLRAIDDDIANGANVEDMISVFKNIDAQTVTLTPSDYNLKEIGHMKFFSRQSKVLWQHTLSWLATH
ncbi:MAG: alpha/beta fold hydrolase [Psychrobium sp.]|nr:alpha/beta fold hydrolase [Psychrobium sp.]